jgi:hypothetical protein
MEIFNRVVAKFWKEEDLFRRNDDGVAQTGVFVAIGERVEESVLAETRTNDPECVCFVINGFVDSCM